MQNIFDNLEKYSSKIAFHDQNDNEITYSELISKSQILAKKLKRSQVLLLQCDNSFESIVCYVTCLRSNVVPILLDANLEHEKLYNYAKIYNAKYIFTKNLDLLPKDFYQVYSSNEFPLYEHKSFDLEGKIHKDLAALIPTSGSTGNPKLVRISHENLISNSFSIIDYLNISELDKPMTVLPMNYTFGLSILNTHLISGCKIILNNHSVLSKDFWKIFDKNKPSTISGVPYTFEIFKKINLFSKDLSFLKKVTQAGGKLNKELVLFFSKHFRDLNIDFYVMYGQTEATARMSYLPPKDNIEKPESIGIPIPGGELLLLGENNNYIKTPLQSGRLIYKGSNVSMGYAQSFHDLKNEDENNNYLNTGDIAYFDREGYFYINGRESGFVKIFGNRINLLDVQAKVDNLGYVNVVTGNDLLIKIYIENDESLDKDEILTIKKELARFTKLNFNAFEVLTVFSLPRNNAGKILLKDL